MSVSTLFGLPAFRTARMPCISPSKPRASRPTILVNGDPCIAHWNAISRKLNPGGDW